MRGALGQSAGRVLGSLSRTLSHPVYGRRSSAAGPQGAGREALRHGHSSLSLRPATTLSAPCFQPPAHRHPPARSKHSHVWAATLILSKEGSFQWQGETRQSNFGPFQESHADVTCICCHEQRVWGEGAGVMQKSRTEEECPMSRKSSR